jgi:hypothetical protein
MYVTRAGNTLQGTTVCVALQMVAPTFIEGLVVQFQPAQQFATYCSAVLGKSCQ